MDWKLLGKSVSPKFRALVESHHPVGYSLEIVKLRGETAAFAEFVRRIVVEGIHDRDGIFLYLHEVGHVVNKHLVDINNKKGSPPLPRWREEYEADQYAIAAMREAGIAVPRDRLQHQKKEVRCLIESCPQGVEVEDAVLKYAYGKAWRKHR